MRVSSFLLAVSGESWFSARASSFEALGLFSFPLPSSGEVKQLLREVFKHHSSSSCVVVVDCCGVAMLCRVCVRVVLLFWCWLWFSRGLKWSFQGISRSR